MLDELKHRPGKAFLAGIIATVIGWIALTLVWWKDSKAGLLIGLVLVLACVGGKLTSTRRWSGFWFLTSSLVTHLLLFTLSIQLTHPGDGLWIIGLILLAGGAAVMYAVAFVIGGSFSRTGKSQSVTSRPPHDNDLLPGRPRRR
ncbi:MAG: hypothetical protein JWS12_615 [Candidatus Saccharibacteria bacterium]|nr:hypothetical protein [Candidatus Saccharibacteria bacterium]